VRPLAESLNFGCFAMIVRVRRTCCSHCSGSCSNSLAPFVGTIILGGVLVALKDDDVRVEAIGGGREVQEGKLKEKRNLCSSSRYWIESNGRCVGLGFELDLLLLFFLGASLSKRTHNNP
jgi:hypothetical protein